jgi:hypothetical protein
MGRLYSRNEEILKFLIFGFYDFQENRVIGFKNIIIIYKVILKDEGCSFEKIINKINELENFLKLLQNNSVEKNKVGLCYSNFLDILEKNHFFKSHIFDVSKYIFLKINFNFNYLKVLNFFIERKPFTYEILKIFDEEIKIENTIKNCKIAGLSEFKTEAIEETLEENTSHISLKTEVSDPTKEKVLIFKKLFNSDDIFECKFPADGKFLFRKCQAGIMKKIFVKFINNDIIIFKNDENLDIFIYIGKSKTDNFSNIKIDKILNINRAKIKEEIKIVLKSKIFYGFSLNYETNCKTSKHESSELSVENVFSEKFYVDSFLEYNEWKKLLVKNC